MGRSPGEGHGPMSERNSSVFRNQNAIIRGRIGRDAIAQAYAASDADECITQGDWHGFTRAEAQAWCWNLYQFEPHGFVYPNSVIRMQREEELESGRIPEGGGYAAKARTYVARGITPLQYRDAREALGSPTFCWSDVRYSA